MQSTIAQQNATLQTSQNGVDQAQAALASQQATAAQTTAGPTQADLDTANAQVDNAAAALQLAQNDLAAAVLTAPSSGTVASLNGAVGQWISGGPTSSTSSTATTSSDALITLSDLSSPQVSAAVSEADIGKVQAGQKVDLLGDGVPHAYVQRHRGGG